MGISQAQPLLLFLLVSLFVLPALGIKFYPCYTGNHKFIEVRSVDLSPDPVKRSGNANVTVTGFTSEDIPDGASVVIGLTLPMVPISVKSYPLCDVTTCPVAPGPFVLTIPNIFTAKEKKRSRAYNVFVSITENPEDPADVPVMCVNFVCKIRGYMSMLSQVTE